MERHQRYSSRQSECNKNNCQYFIYPGEILYRVNSNRFARSAWVEHFQTLVLATCDTHNQVKIIIFYHPVAKRLGFPYCQANLYFWGLLWRLFIVSLLFPQKVAARDRESRIEISQIIWEYIVFKPCRVSSWHQYFIFLFAGFGIVDLTGWQAGWKQSCVKVLSWVTKRKYMLAVRKSIKESGERPWIRFKALSDNLMSQ